jgi:uncharacterized protein (UPF0261 family)
VLKTAARQVERLPFHINDPEFGAAIAGNYLHLVDY